MNDLFVKGVLALAEVTGDTTGETTKSVAEKINDFFAKPEMKATISIILCLVVMAIFTIAICVLFKRRKKH